MGYSDTRRVRCLVLVVGEAQEGKGSYGTAAYGTAACRIYACTGYACTGAFSGTSGTSGGPDEAVLLFDVTYMGAQKPAWDCFVVGVVLVPTSDGKSRSWSFKCQMAFGCMAHDDETGR